MTLSIRPEQLAAVVHPLREILAGRLADHLRTHFGEFAAQADPLERRTLALVVEVEALGIRSSQAFFRTANLAALFGWGVLHDPEHAWIAEWLRDAARGATPDERLAAVMRRVMFEAARKARH